MYLRSKLIFVLLYLICKNCLLLQSGIAQVYPDSTAEYVTNLQKKITAHLTGVSQDEYVSRSSPKERKTAASFLEETLEKLGIPASQHSYRSPNVNGFVDLIFAPYKGKNVYGLLAATSASNKYVIIGAHYDSEPGTPGAIDNASGVSVVSALAYKLSTIQNRSVNFVFVFFDQEEDDEVGSKAFVKYLKEKEWAVHSVHVIDSIGWGEEEALPFTVQTTSPMIQNIYQKTSELLDLPLYVIGGRGHSDNISFEPEGYHTAGFWDEKLTPNIHKPSDTFETVNFDRLRLATNYLYEILKTINKQSHAQF